jgi:hypothetical protein
MSCPPARREHSIIRSPEVLPRLLNDIAGPGQENAVLFLGDDWAEDHHDVELQDPTGRRLATARLGEGIAGSTRLHELIGRHLPEDADGR